MDFYNRYLKELSNHGYHIDISLNTKDKKEFENNFKRIFPQKVVDLIINNNIRSSPVLINSDSVLLSITAKFCLCNSK